MPFKSAFKFSNFNRTYTVPINDGYWHHVGFTWSDVIGNWLLLIDGVLWANETISKTKSIPSGGVLTVGKLINNGTTYNLVGKISRLNLWSNVKTGEEIEAVAKSPGSRDGDLISWFMVKDHVSEARIISPSNASFSGLLETWAIFKQLLLTDFHYQETLTSFGECQILLLLPNL